MKLPDQMLVEARLPSHALANPAAEITARLEATLGKENLAGRGIAVGVGSRGIDRIAEVVLAVVTWLKSRGARPYLLPAMGSHGGGTAAGQTELLASYAITEATMGVAVHAAMETLEIGRTEAGAPVFIAREALEAEGLIVINRVKPHTDFESTRLGSGLLKMCAIGLGKVEGAGAAHRAAALHGYEASILAASRLVRGKVRLIAGVALVEDPHHHLAIVEVIPAAAIEAREPDLLAQARAWMPALPFAEIDVLILDEIGKNISGAGMDTNVVGRKFNDHIAAEHEWPKIKRIIIRDLTEATHGNACGIGMSEFCRSRCIEKMDAKITRINCLTGGHPTGAMLPLDYATDRECLDAALPTIGLTEPPQAKVMWAHNTLDVAEVECSVAYLNEARERSDLEIIKDPRPLAFDAAGNLPDHV